MKLLRWDIYQAHHTWPNWNAWECFISCYKSSFTFSCPRRFPECLNKHLISPRSLQNSHTHTHIHTRICLLLGFYTSLISFPFLLYSRYFSLLSKLFSASITFIFLSWYQIPPLSSLLSLFRCSVFLPFFHYPSRCFLRLCPFLSLGGGGFLRSVFLISLLASVSYSLVFQRFCYLVLGFLPAVFLTFYLYSPWFLFFWFSSVSLICCWVSSPRSSLHFIYTRLGFVIPLFPWDCWEWFLSLLLSTCLPPLEVVEHQVKVRGEA